MGALTVFDGHDSIGGTKMLLTDGATRLLLDFGTNYRRMGQYYEEFVKPRPSRGLVDYLALGLLPPLRGFYREDLFPQQDFPHKDEEWDGVPPDAVLVTHGHLDHAGAVGFLRPELPVVMTPMTLALLRSWQETATGGPETEVTYLTRREAKDPRLLKSSENRETRVIWSLGDAPDPFVERLRESPYANPKRGSFEPRDPCPAPLRVGSIGLDARPVDHSVYGGVAYILDLDGSRVAYSGDLRFHGEHGSDTEALMRRLEDRNPDVLVVEGTRLGSSPEEPLGPSPSEATVKGRSLSKVREYEGRLVVADFGPRNVERLKTFREVAQETGRQLVLVPKDAHILDLLSRVDPAIPHDMDPGGMRILREPTLQSRAPLQRIEERYSDAFLDPEDIVEDPGNWILCFSFFDANDLVDLRKATPGGLWLYSSSEAHGEEQEFDFVRLQAWTQWARMKVVGFRLERDREGTLRPRFDHPEDRGYHASGHAPERDLVELVRRANPHRLIPIHTETPRAYDRLLQGTRIQVVHPVPGVPISL